MTIEEIIFYFFGGLIVVSAIAMALVKNIVHAALAFLIVLLGVAILFIYSQAEFVAVSQIMIYVGGVLVLMIFGVMLTANYTGIKERNNIYNSILVGLFCMIIFLGLLYTFNETDLEIAIYNQTKFELDYSSPFSSVRQIGIQLMTEYLLPFEASGILLMTALMGAAMISSRKKSKLNDTN